jgi:two-component system KDP operon response regulator KdpE
VATVETLLHPVLEPAQSPSGLSSDGQADEIVLDQHQCQVFVRGAPVKLTNHEYRLLTFFVHNRGCVLTAKQILDQVWGWELGEHTRSLHTYVWRLRHKIESDPQRPNFLLNEYGTGYRFTCN